MKAVITLHKGISAQAKAENHVNEILSRSGVIYHVQFITATLYMVSGAVPT